MITQLLKRKCNQTKKLHLMKIIINLLIHLVICPTFILLIIIMATNLIQEIIHINIKLMVLIIIMPTIITTTKPPTTTTTPTTTENDTIYIKFDNSEITNDDIGIINIQQSLNNLQNRNEYLQTKLNEIDYKSILS